VFEIRNVVAHGARWRSRTLRNLPRTDGGQWTLEDVTETLERLLRQALQYAIEHETTWDTIDWNAIALGTDSV